MVDVYSLLITVGIVAGVAVLVFVYALCRMAGDCDKPRQLITPVTRLDATRRLLEKSAEENEFWHQWGRG